MVEAKFNSSLSLVSAARLRVLDELQHDVGLDALQPEQHVGQQRDQLQHPGLHVLHALQQRVACCSLTVCSHVLLSRSAQHLLPWMTDA